MSGLFLRNAWATEQLLDFCDARPEVVTAPAGADVYGDIKASFNHIVYAEQGFLRLITGEKAPDYVKPDQPRTLADLREPLRWLGVRWQALLESDRDVEAVRAIPRGDGQVLIADWVGLVHTLHHSDDHRAQIGTVLGRHGVGGPDLDVWAFSSTEPGNPEGRAWLDGLLRHAFDHHLWATDRLLRACSSFTPEQLALTAPGTYGSIIATLTHLVSADRSYLSGLKGTGRLPALENAGIEPLVEHLAEARKGWASYLESKPDFEAMITRRDGQVPAWVIAAQAIHHGNDHRTHVGTVMLAHEIEVQHLDAWDYARSEGFLKEPTTQ